MVFASFHLITPSYTFSLLNVPAQAFIALHSHKTIIPSHYTLRHFSSFLQIIFCKCPNFKCHFKLICWFTSALLGNRQHEMPRGATAPAAPAFTVVSKIPEYLQVPTVTGLNATLTISTQKLSSCNCLAAQTKWAVSCLASSSQQTKTPPGFSLYLSQNDTEDKAVIPKTTISSSA